MTVSPVEPPVYDAGNIFAKILRGEAPCHKIYEDADTLAFMDIMPRSDGHALIVPKKAARNILDAPPALLGPVILTAQRIAQAAMRAFACDGITVGQFSEPAGGQVVFHIHFHVIPRWTGVELRPPGIVAEDAVLQQHAAGYLRAFGS